jgi:hypothetical protein
VEIIVLDDVNKYEMVFVFCVDNGFIQSRMNGKSIQKHVAILGTQDKCKQSKNTIQKNEQMSNREPTKKPRGLMCSRRVSSSCLLYDTGYDCWYFTCP